MLPPLKAGNVAGLDLMLQDSALVYEVIVEGDEHEVAVYVDAATGDVLAVETDADGEDDDSEGEDDQQED